MTNRRVMNTPPKIEPHTAVSVIEGEEVAICYAHALFYSSARDMQKIFLDKCFAGYNYVPGNTTVL